MKGHERTSTDELLVNGDVKRPVPFVRRQVGIIGFDQKPFAP